MRITTSRSTTVVRLLAALPLLAVAGCDTSTLSRNFGLTRDAPDEFTVTTQAPLSMPPDYNLRPPRPGAARPQQQAESVQAEEALIPQVALGGPQTSGSSPGQTALLQESGPTAPRDIRRRVDQDARVEEANEGFLDKVLYWRKPDTQNVTVDAAKETQRLKQNAALGQSPEVGETPRIQQRRQGWFQSLFSWL
jgi:Protein of unknown function (DUF3035)